MKLGMRYMLINGEVVATDNFVEWAMWFASADRCVAFTDLGDCQVSTVFLGIDRGFNRAARPILFETMMFSYNTSNDLEMTRCCTLDEAMAMHDAMVSRILSHGVIESNE